MAEAGSTRQTVAPVASDDLIERARKYADAFMTFCGPLSEAEREAFRLELERRLAPRTNSPSTPLLGTIVNLFERKPNWRVQEIKQAVTEQGIAAQSKSIYNALTHLARRGRIQQIGYGRYAIRDYGITLETTDDLTSE